MNSMNCHRVTKIVTSAPQEACHENGKAYYTGEIVIFFTDYAGHPQRFNLNLFGDTPEQLTIRGKA